MAIAQWIIGSLLLLVTALPFLHSDSRFVRIWDFPRAQIAFLLAVVLIAAIVQFGFARWQALLWEGILALAFSYQLYRIYPYTPLSTVEALRAEEGRRGDGDAVLRLLVANVRQSNRDAAPILQHIAKLRPDLVLLVETDSWWAARLEPLRNDYPNVVAQPQDDTYGMLLFSRLPLIDPRVRFLIDEYVPSIETGVRLASGDVIDFHGVHPKPPPLHDTDERDAELLIVGRKVRADSVPAIVGGDLNDVAWSDTTRLFQRVSGLLDPRIGRGLYSTYNANWPLLRWPLDHVFFEQSFVLLEMRRLGYIGSDHFPFYIALSYQPGAPRAQAPPARETETIRRARRAIEEGREKAREED